jgi:hypothetical protein
MDNQPEWAVPWLASRAPMFAVVLAVLAFLLIMRIGLSLIRALSRPMPEPPPPGELRRVALQYRCTICGAELKMTRASEELPEPPRHCLEDMELLAPID